MQTLLFVCTGNYYRSRFAEAVFNCESEQRGLDWRSISRGLALDPKHADLSRHTIAALEARQIARHHTAPGRVAIAPDDFAQAQRIILLDRAEHYPMMNRMFPEWADRVEYWAVPDVGFRDPQDALKEIEANVYELLEELSPEPLPA